MLLKTKLSGSQQGLSGATFQPVSFRPNTQLPTPALIANMYHIGIRIVLVHLFATKSSMHQQGYIRDSL